MHILVLGASGRTGKLVVEQAVAAGHQVTAFVRNPQSIMPAGVTIVAGDARREADLVRALQGVDAVISTLGSNNTRDSLIAQSSTALIAAAKKTGVKRVIIMSSFLAKPNFKPAKFVQFLLRSFGGVVSDINAGTAQFESSGLDYTIVSATRLTNSPLNPHYRVVLANEQVGARDKISRADVAHFLLALLQDTSYIGESIIVTDA